jgi:hypothetical protein
MNKPASTRRFDRGARFTLIFTATIFVLATGFIAYRFSLPTDGWLSGEPDEIDSVGYIYEANIIGVPSGLQPGDHLVAVEGIALAETGFPDLLSLKDSWRAGNTVRYTVLRGEQTVELDVPLTHWDVGQYLRETQSAADLVTYLGVFAFLGISLLAFWRRPENPAARALLVLATIVLVLYLAVDLLPGMVIDEVFVAAAYGGFLFTGALFSLLLPPAFIRFALVFPEPVPFLRRRPWLAFAPYGVGLLVFGAFLAQIYVFGWLWMATSTFITLALLIYSAITVHDAVGRAQLRWGLGGAIAGFGFFFLTYLPVFLPVPAPVENFLNATTGFGFGIMGIALGIAVLRYRLFDIDVIIRKTTSYAILTALLALVYFGSIVVLQRLLSPITGESDVAVVLSTLLIAALFLPLRRRVQAAIDRRFFRQKYDAEQVLAQFAATARDETDLDALTAELMRVIQETMEPESVSVWLRPAADQKPRTTDH